MNSILNWFVDRWHDFHTAFIEYDRYKAYLEGLRMTLIMSLLAVALGIAIGVIIAVVKYSSARRSKRGFGSATLKFFEVICNLYTTIIRGTPVFVQLLIIYNMIFRSKSTPALVSGVICFGINSGAYVSEIIRAGLESIDKGQMEAGKSLGLSSIKTMMYIILPQAVKNILPALGNEFISLIKETAIAGAIPILEVTKAAQNVSGTTFDFVTPLLITAAMYLIIVIGLTKLLKIFERRLAKSDRR